MKTLIINKRFTLLELLIAVVILVIVSAVVVSIFQETLRSYKKGIAYSDISDNLSGSFMVMESDLSKLLPIEDKNSVFFKKEAFSFVALKETDKKKSFLQLVRYRYDKDEKKLYRAIVKYPADKQNLDGKDIAFCVGLESLNFNYSYAASDKEKKKDKDDSSEDQSSSSLFDGENSDDGNNFADSSTSSGKPKDSKSSKKSPSIINIAGKIKNEDVEQNFSTALFVRSMEAVKSTGSSTDSDKKDSSKNKDSQSNDKNTGN